MVKKSKGYRTTSKENDNAQRKFDEATKGIAELDFDKPSSVVTQGQQKMSDLYKEYSCKGMSVAPILPVEADPPCDYCGKDFSGTKACAKCHCLFYCSRECQKAHWKEGHKAECDNMAAECQLIGKQAVEYAMGTHCSDMERVECFEKLQGNAYYKVAEKNGLYAALQQLMNEEAEQVLQRYRSGSLVSYMQWIMCTLFRGNRREGRQGYGSTAYNGSFSHICSYRCTKFVKSHPQAFTDWFTASMTVVTVFLDPIIAMRNVLKVQSMRAARDVVAAWSFCFTNPLVAKTILLGESQVANEAAQARAKWITAQVKPVLSKMWNVADDIDTGSAVEGQLNQVCALIFLRLVEHGVYDKNDKPKYMKQLGLKGTQKTMFTRVAIPYADHMMRKGRAVTNEESKVILRGGRIEY